MNNFQHFITPEKAYEFELSKPGGPQRTLEDLRAMARAKGTCEVCETEAIWRYGGTGLCFSCTTGEADASDDYELIPSRGEEAPR